MECGRIRHYMEGLRLLCWTRQFALAGSKAKKKKKVLSVDAYPQFPLVTACICTLVCFYPHVCLQPVTIQECRSSQKKKEKKMF